MLEQISSALLLPSLSLFAANCKPTFFGLIPWYQYLNMNASCELVGFNILPTPGNPSDVPLIFLAIIDDLLRVAGMVAVAFVIYAGIQYITSQGNPEKAAKALQTLINALIGAGIAITAIALVAFVGATLGH